VNTALPFQPVNKERNIFQMSKNEIKLMLQIIENLSTYTTDDNYTEMIKDEIRNGIPTFKNDVDTLQNKLKGML